MKTFGAGVLIALGVALGSVAVTDARQSPTVQARPSPTATKEFEEASVRPCDPDNLPDAPAGARGGGANSFRMTPGRTQALCMTLATLIRTAYGYGPANADVLEGARGGLHDMRMDAIYGLGTEDGVRVRGGYDWVRSERYTIDAVADAAANAETMRGEMLLALLERRFHLKAHIESEDRPAYALTVARGGLKIKPVGPDACTPISPPDQPSVIKPRTFDEVRRGVKPSCGFFMDRRGPNWTIVAGGTSLSSLTQFLGFPLGVRVIDRTGITETFTLLAEFAIDENAPGPSNGRGAPPSNPSATNTAPAATVFRVFEDELGLKLEPARTTRDFIIIDHVERLSAN